MLLFWEKGYGATSLDELLTALQISRSSFYAAFENKEAIFREALALYQRRNYEALADQLRQSASGLDFIRFVLEIALREAEGKQPARGCLLVNTAGELGKSHPGIDLAVTASLATFEKIFRKAVERAMDEDSLPRDTDAAALASLLSATLGGLRTLSKSGTAPKKIRASIETLLKAISK